jgi:hypothetical protein
MMSVGAMREVGTVMKTLRQVIEQVEQLGPDEQAVVTQHFQRVLRGTH